MVSDPSRNKRIVWSLVLLVAVLRYDFWFWADRSLVFGFMPVGLFYQVLISAAAGITWFLMVKLAWPSHLEEWADEVPSSEDSVTGNPVPGNSENQA